MVRLLTLLCVLQVGIASAQNVLRSAVIRSAQVGQSASFSIPADSFLSFDSGTVGATVGDVSMLNAQTRNRIGTWTLNNTVTTNFWISNNFAPAWPAPVNIDGTIYNQTPTRTWVTGMTNFDDWVIYTFGSQCNYCLIGGFMWFSLPHLGSAGYNPLIIEVNGSSSYGLNVSDLVIEPNYIKAESSSYGGSARFITPQPTNHWVWVTAVCSNGAISLTQIWEPTNHTQIGLTSDAVLTSVGQIKDVLIGRQDQHTQFPTNAYIAFSGMVIVTNPAKASFPLLPWQVTLDTTAPTVAFTNIHNGDQVTDQTQTIQGTASDSVAVASGLGAVNLDVGTGFTNASGYIDAIGTTNWSYTAYGIPLGSNTFKVRAIDNAGNISATQSVSFNVISSYAQKDSNTGAATGVETPNRFTGGEGFGIKFVAGSSYTLTKVDLFLTAVGSPTMNLTVHVFSNSSDLPNSDLGASSSISATTLTASPTQTSFTGGTLSVALTSGTTYWIVMCSSAVDSANYVNVDFNANLLSGNCEAHSSSCGSGYTSLTQFHRSRFITYAANP